MNKNITINLPPCCETFMWENKKNNVLKIYTKIHNKYFSMVVYKKKNRTTPLYIDKWSNSVVLTKKKLNPSNLKIENYFRNFLKSINLYYFKKIKFKGKGFRIKFLKKNKIIKFYFGKSHISFVFLKKIIKKRVNKYKFILRSVNLKELNRICYIIASIKKFNVYTLRGIRFSKQTIFKRKGKKGTYI